MKWTLAFLMLGAMATAFRPLLQHIHWHLSPQQMSNKGLERQDVGWKKRASIPLRMGLFDGLKKMTKGADIAEVLAQENDLTLKVVVALAHLLFPLWNHISLFCPSLSFFLSIFPSVSSLANTLHAQKEYSQRVEKINLLEEEIENFSNDQLIAKTQEFKDRLTSGRDTLDSLLTEAFAVVTSTKSKKKTLCYSVLIIRI